MIPANIPAFRPFLRDPQNNPSQFKLITELTAQDLDTFEENFSSTLPQIHKFRETTNNVQNLDAQFQLISKIQSLISFRSWDIQRLFPSTPATHNAYAVRFAGPSSNLLEERAALINKIFSSLHLQPLTEMPEDGNSLLHEAASAGRADLVTALIQAGVTVDAKNDAGVTPFMLAVLTGHFDIAETLLAAGANINAQALAGKTVLSAAALGQKSNAVEFLLNHHADPNLVDIKQRSPLWYLFSKAPHNAAVQKNIAINLTNHGAKTDFQLPNGNYLFHFAIWQQWNDLVDVILHHTENKQALLNRRNEDGATPLHEAIDSCQFELASIFIDGGASATIKNTFGVSPLQAAFHKNAPLLILKMLNKDSDCNFQLYENEISELRPIPLFIYAIDRCFPFENDGYRQHPEWKAVAERLLELGKADIHAKDSRGRTLLHAALGVNLPDLAMKLLDLGVDPTIEDDRKNTALHYFAKNRMPLDAAKALVQKLKAKGTCLDAQDQLQRTALNCNPTPDVASLLLESGANTEIPDFLGRTPLWDAVNQKDLPRMELLVKHKAKLDVTDTSNTSILHLAAQHGLADWVTALLKEPFATKEYISRQNKENETALSLACKNDHTETAVALLKAGAASATREANGMTPFAWALKNQNPDLALLLLETNPDLDIKIGIDEMPPLLAAYDCKRRSTLSPQAEKWNTVFQKLFENQGGLECCDKTGRTLLHMACEAGAYADAIAFCEKGIVPTRTKNAENVLHLIVKEASSFSPLLKNLIEKLLEKRVGIDETDSKGNTAFFLACRKNKKELAELLYAHHANPRLVPPGELPAIFSLITNGWTDLFREFVAKKISLDAASGFKILQLCLTIGRPECLKVLLDQETVTINMFAQDAHNAFYTKPFHDNNNRLDCLEAIFGGPVDLQGKSINDFIFSLDAHPEPLLGYKRSPLEIAFLLCRALPIQAMIKKNLYPKIALEQDFEALTKKYTFCVPGGFCPISTVEFFRIAALYTTNPDHLEALPLIPQKPGEITPEALIAGFRTINMSDEAHKEPYIDPQTFGIEDALEGEKRLERFLASLDRSHPKWSQIEAGLCYIAKACTDQRSDKKAIFSSLLALSGKPMSEVYTTVRELYSQTKGARLPQEISIQSLKEIFHAQPGVSAEEKARLATFIEKITQKRLSGLNPNNEKDKKTYEAMESSLAQIAASIKAGEADPLEVFSELGKLYYTCGPALYSELTELYYKTARKIAPTFENILLLSLENFRRSLVKSCIATLNAKNKQTRHDYIAIIKAYPELALPEACELGHFDDIYQQPHMNEIHKKIIDLIKHQYTPHCMLEWLIPNLLQHEKTRNLFLDYMKTQVPATFHAGDEKEDREHSYLEEVVYDANNKIRPAALLDTLEKQHVIRAL